MFSSCPVKGSFKSFNIAYSLYHSPGNIGFQKENTFPSNRPKGMESEINIQLLNRNVCQLHLLREKELEFTDSVDVGQLLRRGALRVRKFYILMSEIYTLPFLLEYSIFITRNLSSNIKWYCASILNWYCISTEVVMGQYPVGNKFDDIVTIT